jgi:aerobic-type carbon monoxide dehydrogenase small subunit (CoxS/CutS family)
MALLEIKVNGREHQLAVEHTASLLTVLREHLHVTSPKVGCETGDCGACNVLVDGELRRACLTNAMSVNGSEVVTVEGIGEPTDLHPVQKRFYENYASQCGYCTPGMVLASKALLDRNPTPSEEQIKEALSGNLCRCAGYVNIIQAVKDAAADLAGKGGAQ